MNEPTAISFGRVNTIYVFGDSHALCLDMRVYQLSGKTFAFREMFVPLFRPSSLVFDDELPSKVAAALKKASLTWSVGGFQAPTHSSNYDWSRHIAYMRASPHQDPPLLFSFGFNELADFSLELATARETLDDRTALVRRFTEKLQPMVRAFSALRGQTFNRLAVLAIAPFTSDDNAFGALLEGVGAPHPADYLFKDWRTTLFSIGNEALAIIAGQSGAAFVPPLPEHEENGLAKPGALIDHIHYSTWALDRVAEQVIQLMHDGYEWPELTAAPAFYQLYLDIQSLSEITIDATTFESIRAAPPGTIVRLEDVNTRVSFWTSASRIRYIVGIHSAEPTLKLLVKTEPGSQKVEESTIEGPS